MGCDYYIQSELVVEYIDTNGGMSTTKTNRTLEKGYIFNVADMDSDDDDETQYKKYLEEIDKNIARYTYKKNLYENELWIKSSYEKNYKKDIQIMCPTMIRLVKVYKDYHAWKRF